LLTYLYADEELTVILVVFYVATLQVFECRIVLRCGNGKSPNDDLFCNHLPR